MPSTTAALPAPEPSALRHRLAALRRRLRHTAIIRGVSWILLFTAVVAVAVGALDFVLPLPSLVRAGVLVGWLVGAGLLAWHFLVRPLSERCDDLSLALRIEQRFPALNDALASTVQFLDAPPAGGDSASMRREAVKRALGKAAGCDFNRVVDGRGLRTAGALAAFASAGALALALYFPGPAFSALGRLLNPFNNRDLPPQTVLELDAPRDRIGRNEAFEIHGRVRGVVPAKAFVAVRIDNFPSTEYTIDVASSGDKSGTLSLRLEPGKVQRNFRFQVAPTTPSARSTRSRCCRRRCWRRSARHLRRSCSSFIRATPVCRRRRCRRPASAPSTPWPALPSYCGPRPTVGCGAAWVEYLPEPKAVTPAACLCPLGACDLMSFLSLSAASAAVWGRTDAELDDDHTSFTVRFLPARVRCVRAAFRG